MNIVDFISHDWCKITLNKYKSTTDNTLIPIENNNYIYIHYLTIRYIQYYLYTVENNNYRYALSLTLSNSTNNITVYFKTFDDLKTNVIKLLYFTSHNINNFNKDIIIPSKFNENDNSNIIIPNMMTFVDEPSLSDQHINMISMPNATYIFKVIFILLDKIQTIDIKPEIITDTSNYSLLSFINKSKANSMYLKINDTLFVKYITYDKLKKDEHKLITTLMNNTK